MSARLFPHLAPLYAAWLPLTLLLFGCDTAYPQQAAEVRSGRPIPTAFFYGKPVPLQRLAGYERLVLEADNLPDAALTLPRLAAAGTTVFAYVSVGEAEGWRESTRRLGGELFFGDNAAWQSRVADLSQLAWRDFLINERMAGLWRQGYRAFFLDTLDSYEQYVHDPAQRKRQACALAAIVRAMHDRFPGVQLLLNRGFDALPQIGSLASGLAAESLFRGWDQKRHVYVEVSEADRNWLLSQLESARIRYGLPITVIDYVDPDAAPLARRTLQQIEALGFSAWVATPALDSLPELAP
ncbi:MAG: endo alpha-1,4 polygalactosaminidase [Janthinobacterium lividum]